MHSSRSNLNLISGRAQGTQMVHDDDDDEAVDSSHSVSDLGMRITMSMPIPFPLADPSVRRVTQI